jgi:hypothetical protein
VPNSILVVNTFASRFLGGDKGRSRGEVPFAASSGIVISARIANVRLAARPFIEALVGRF